MAHRANKYPNMTQTTIFGEKREQSFSPESRSNTIKTTESSLKSGRTTLVTNESIARKPQEVTYLESSRIVPIQALNKPQHDKVQENNNLVKQNPAGKIFLKKKNKIFDKPQKMQNKNQAVYYS
jgi:hypothetical protein